MSTGKSPPAGPARRVRAPLITLFTDFGAADPFVGVMRGVILGICPEACLVDLGHDAARFDPVAAGFVLASAVPYFPRGTIHVAVVDPGVGGPRRPLAARIDGQLFVAPDNGLLAWLLAGARSAEVRWIVEPRLMRQPVSATFHGRDVFAPAAAHLARGFPLRRVGPAVCDPVRPPVPRPALEPGPAVRGQVMWVDRFGNLITNLDLPALAALGEGLPAAPGAPPREGAGLRVIVGRGRPLPVVAHYGAVEPGRVAAVMGSSGHLEIFANRGSAAGILGAGAGTAVRAYAAGPAPPRPPRGSRGAGERRGPRPC